MEYKIIGKKGVIITRQPEVITDSLSVTFTNAPEDATAIFKTLTNSFYRKLEDNACTIPLKAVLYGAEVTLTVLDGQANPPVYQCEGIKAQRLNGAETVVMPNDGDLPNIVVELQVELQATNDKVTELETKLTKLEDRITDMLEGYDIV